MGGGGEEKVARTADPLDLLPYIPPCRYTGSVAVSPRTPASLLS